jgi:Fic family protein
VAKLSVLVEIPSRIEPTRLDQLSENTTDLVAELSASAAVLGRALHPQTAATLASLVRIMNTYYSNLIEGHKTRPRDIERAMTGDLDTQWEDRNLQLEAVAHVRLQAEIDQLFAENRMPNPVSTEFVLWLHREFYQGAPADFLRIKGAGREFIMTPGKWRSLPEHDVEVGSHFPPSSERVSDFMAYFETTYSRELAGGRTAKTIALAASHHRFNYIHPFPDGNGRVSRLMSHAITHTAGIGAHGLWSVSRGLARGLNSRTDYKNMMAHADMPRQGDLDGRGNLSRKALSEFVEWFLRVCLDQINFMSELFDIENLRIRLRRFVELNPKLAPQAVGFLEEALIRGQFERGEVGRITGLPDRTARRLFQEVLATGILASDTPRGPVSLRFSSDNADILFPRLYPET